MRPLRPQWREFGTPLPLDSALSAAQEVLRTLAGVAGLADAVTDNASVHVVPWDTSRGTGLAMSETFASWYEFDPRTLQTGELGYLAVHERVQLDSSREPFRFLSNCSWPREV